MGHHTFVHNMDVGVAGSGATLKEAFCDMATAMFALMTELETVRPETSVEIFCKLTDNELLLVACLNVLLADDNLRDMLS